jgi:hypothetical protein
MSLSFSKLVEQYPDLKIEQIVGLRKERLQKYALENPKSRENLLFHGGCIDCETPTNKGVKTCLSCRYCYPNWHLPNLSSHDT